MEPVTDVLGVVLLVLAVGALAVLDLRRVAGRATGRLATAGAATLVLAVLGVVVVRFVALAG